MKEVIAGLAKNCAIGEVPCVYLRVQSGEPYCTRIFNYISRLQDCDTGVLLDRAGVKKVTDRHTNPVLHEANRLNARLLARREIIDKMQADQDKETEQAEVVRRKLMGPTPHSQRNIYGEGKLGT